MRISILGFRRVYGVECRGVKKTFNLHVAESGSIGGTLNNCPRIMQLQDGFS